MKFFNWFDKYPVIKYWCPVYACIVLILYFSLAPSPPDTVGGHTLNFNILHFIAYFVLCFLMIIAMANSRTNTFKKRPYYLSLFFCVAFGIFNEMMQFFVPGRGPSSMDVVYNSGAVVLSQLVSLAIKNIRAKINSK